MSTRVSAERRGDGLVLHLDLAAPGEWEDRISNPSAALLERIASEYENDSLESITVSARVSSAHVTGDPYAMAASEMVRGVTGSAALEFADRKKRANCVIWDGVSNQDDLGKTINYLASPDDAGFTTGAAIHLEGQEKSKKALSGSGAVLITGGAGGLGRAAAERLLAEGRKVVITDMPGDMLDRATDELGVPGFGANLSDPAQVDALSNWDETEGIDTLLIHHGVGASSRLNSNYDESSGLRSISVNGTAVSRVFEAFRPALVARGSSTVVMLSSQAGLVAEPGNGAYGAAKFAVVGFVRGNAASLKEDGIRLQGLCPGPIDTPLMRAAFAGFARDLGISEEEFTAQRLGAIPLKRAGDPKHIGAAASYLVSLDASGVILAPTGGEVLS